MSWVTDTVARLLLLRAGVRARLRDSRAVNHLARRHRLAEVGVETITWIVLTAIMVAVAIAAGAIIKTKVLNTANGIQTQ